MGKRFFMVLVLSVVFLSLQREADSESLLHSPHDSSHGLTCRSCHLYPLDGGAWYDPAGVQLFPPASATADDTLRNFICLRCHDGTVNGPDEITAPAMAMHSALSINGHHSGWTTECVSCHDPHFQAQLQHVNDGEGLFLATGTITEVAIDETVPGEDRSRLGYSLDSFLSGWDVPLLWAQKSGPDRGLVLIPDLDRLDENFEVIAADASHITVQGRVVAPGGSGFALLYGQMIRDRVRTPAGTQRPVSFFEAGAGLLTGDGNPRPGGFVDESNGQLPEGICQVCHTETGHWRDDGSLAATGVHASLNDAACLDCHPHGNGFKVSYADHSTKITPTPFCQACHPGTIPEIHATLNCATCHALPDYLPLGGRLPGDLGAYILPLTCGSCHGAGHDTENVHDHRVSAGMSVDCTGCHDAASQAAIDALHSAGCQTCHAYPGGKLDAARVAAAIEAGKTPANLDQNCEACHIDAAADHAAAHDAAHADRPQCLACHFDNLVAEHVQRRGYGCATCHQSPVTAVTDTVARGWSGPDSVDVFCADCHSNAEVNPAGNITAAHHATEFSLNGDCTRCHVVGRGLDAPKKAACVKCHNSGNWFDPQGPYFNAHANGPAITDAILDVRVCFSCHLEGAQGYMADPNGLPVGDPAYAGTPVVTPLHAMPTDFSISTSSPDFYTGAEDARLSPGKGIFGLAVFAMEHAHATAYAHPGYDILQEWNYNQYLEPARAFNTVPIRLDGTDYVVPADDGSGGGGPATTTGELTVGISPPAAVAAGAQWRLDGTNWRESDAPAVTLKARQYLLEAKMLAGWALPEATTVSVAGNDATSVVLNYLPCPEDPSLTLERSGAPGVHSFVWSDPLQKEEIGVAGFTDGAIACELAGTGGATGFGIEAGGTACTLVKNGPTAPGSYSLIIAATVSGCPDNRGEITLAITVSAEGGLSPDSSSGKIGAPTSELDPVAALNRPVLFEVAGTTLAGDVDGGVYGLLAAENGALVVRTYDVLADGRMQALHSLSLGPADQKDNERTVLRVADGIFALVYANKIKTFGVQNDGSIGGELAEYPFDTTAAQAECIRIAGNIFALTYLKDADACLRTVSIAADGMTITTLDTWQMAAGAKLVSNLAEIGTGLYAVSYGKDGGGYGSDAYLATLAIDPAAGTITKAFLDDSLIGQRLMLNNHYLAGSQEARANPKLIRVNNATLALAYVQENGYRNFIATNDTGVIKTFSYAADGTIRQPAVSSLTFEYWPTLLDSFLPLADGVYAVTYSHMNYSPGSEAYRGATVKTYRIDDAGRIRAEAVDKAAFTGADPRDSASFGHYPALIKVNDWIYQFAFTGSSTTTGGGLKTLCIYNPDTDDIDGDGICDQADRCPDDPTPDLDNDGLCGGNDLCPNDPLNDADGDGVCGDVDSCPNDPANDIDHDGVCGDVDPCPLDKPDDIDGDGVCNSADLCPGFDDAIDSNGNGIPDGCDPCPTDTDPDFDQVCTLVDNCPTAANPDQADTDLDSVGNLCDNCPNTVNADQADTDGNGIGDACGDIPAPPARTGQPYCYNWYASGTIRTCLGLGEDGDYRAGVAWPEPRFTDNGDGTVTDRLTGVVWLRNASCFGDRMGGSQAEGDANSLADGSCGLQDGSLPGDWRLPSKAELESLLFPRYEIPSLPNTAATGKWTAADPFTNVSVATTGYWSATPYGPDPNGQAYRVSIRDGRTVAAGKNSGASMAPVWPVKKIPGVAAPPSPVDAAWPAVRFSKNVAPADDDGRGGGIAGNGVCDGTETCDGTVNDNLTGLVWLQDAACFGARLWSQSLADPLSLADGACGLADGSTAGDWRLPNIVELRSLLAVQYASPAVANGAGTGQWTPDDPFVNVQSGTYWSSTSHGVDDTRGQWGKAYGVNFQDGTVSDVTKDSPYTGPLQYFYVWPVRNRLVDTSGNTPPVADAGEDQAVTVGDTALLDASASTDADGDSLTYSWTITSKPAGSIASLAFPTSANPAFTVDVAGNYVIQLTVHDGTVTNSATVTVLGNNLPVADAGADRAVALSATVTLDGSASSDPNGDPLSYSWSVYSKPAGSAATITSPTTATPAITPDLPGDYILQLIVNDGFIDSAPDYVTIGDSSSMTVNIFAMTFTPVAAGTFPMGSPAGESFRSADEILHQVTLTEAFHIMTTEVTEEQWREVVTWGEEQGFLAPGQLNRNPSGKCAACAVTGVSFDEVMSFVAVLNVSGGGIYNLPTEARWEYAARAGTTTAFAGGGITYQYCDEDPVLNSMGWYCLNWGGSHAVAQKQPNGWGLYDMHGNVAEWVLDYYGPYSAGPVTNPAGPASGTYRAVRGGAWWSSAGECRSAARSYKTLTYKQSDVGFRLVRNPAGNDADNDGIDDVYDLCPDTPGTSIDRDGDGLGDLCDACPLDPANDVDGDGICGDADNCPGVANPGQSDFDGDGTGDACEPTIPMVAASLLEEGFSLALKADSTVWAWGENSLCQLGDATTEMRTSPVPVIEDATVNPAVQLDNVARISAGRRFGLALKKDGTVRAWGFNGAGVLGTGATGGPECTAVQVADPADPSGFLQGVVAVAGGERSALALKADGSVRAWGSNGFGNLGDNTTVTRTTPVQVIEDPGTTPATYLGKVIAIAAGANHSLALKADGSVWAWGSNGSGQLGNNSTAQSTIAIQVLEAGGAGPLTGITAIAAGGTHSLALQADGTVWSWGANGSGQLGDGSGNGSLTPVRVSGPGGIGLLDGIVAIAAGEMNSIALKSDSTVWTWGSNGYGALGADRAPETTPFSLTPVQVVEDPAANPITFLSGVTQVDTSAHGMAQKSDGTVWTWGMNTYGQLGNGQADGYPPPYVHHPHATVVPCFPLPGEDADQDGICTQRDNCPDTANPDQTDSDGNGVGDACENPITTP